MANSDVKRGLVPVRFASGQPYNGACNKYHVAAANAASLFEGDPVVLTGEADGNGIAGVELAGAATAIKGVIVGIVPASTRDELGYLPATTEGYVLVADAVELECEIQANAVVTAAQIGLNAGFALAAGDTFNRVSQVQLDVATAATTATLPLQIIGAPQRIDNMPFDAAGNAKLTVRINSNAGTGV